MNVPMPSSSSSIPSDTFSASQITEVTTQTLLAREVVRRGKVRDAIVLCGLGAAGSAAMSAGAHSIFLMGGYAAFTVGAFSLASATKSKPTFAVAALACAPMITTPIVFALSVKDAVRSLNPNDVHVGPALRVITSLAGIVQLGALFVLGCLIAKLGSANLKRVAPKVGFGLIVGGSALNIAHLTMQYGAMNAGSPWVIAMRASMCAFYAWLAFVSYRVHRVYSR